MEYFYAYLDFFSNQLINLNINLPEMFIMPLFFILHFLVLFFIYYILRKSQQKWRVKASYRYLKKICKITGENEFARTISYLRKIDPFIYEEMILSRLKTQGYKIYRNKRYTGDGGLDGKFKYKGKMFYIQAKRYKSHITKSHVVEFNEIIKRDKVKGLFVHTGKTGKGSKSLSHANMTFLSGQNMVNFLKNKKDISEILNK